MDIDEQYHLHPGTQIDRYVVESVLGQGGMAVVYLVRHQQLGTKHALKILTLAAPSIRKRLLQEGQVQAQLRHPNIVAVTDVITLDNAPGLVMEYIEGPALDDFLKNHTLTYEQADVLAQGIISGVQCAHRADLIHRDLKPANILLEITEHGLVPKVADFGLAKVLSGGGHTATRSGVTMGTPAYMSPEQIRDSKNVDRRADIFSLGCVLYDMVCGERAFYGEDTLALFTAVAHGKFRPPRELKADIPKRFEDAILGALQVDVDERIPSCEALLKVWCGQETVSPKPMATPDGAEWKSTRSSTGQSVQVGDDLPSAPSSPSQTSDTFYIPQGTPVAPRQRTVMPGTAVHFDTSKLAWEPNIPGTESLVRQPENDATSPPSQTSITEGGGAMLLGGGMFLTGVMILAVMGLIGGGTLLYLIAERPNLPDTNSQILEAQVDPKTAAADPAPPDDVPAAPPKKVAGPSVQTTKPAKNDSSAAQPAKSVAPVVPTAPRVVVVVTEPEPTPEVAKLPKKASVVEVKPTAPKPPAGLPPGMGHVDVEGKGRVWLVSQGGNIAPGDVAAGTYEIKVFFDDTPIPTGIITVKAGQTYTIQCYEALRLCRVP